MATQYTVSLNQVIQAAMRLIGRLGAGQVPTAEDYANCTQALNIMIKYQMTQGNPLWTWQQVVVPMVGGKKTYTIGPTGDVVSDRPLRINDAFIRNITGTTPNDTVLQVVSRQQYDMLGAKNSQGVPNQVFYDPQLNNGVLYVYNVPSDDSRTIYLNVQVPIANIPDDATAFDFPQEWYNYLKWGLADEIALEYGATPTVLSLVGAKAAKYASDMQNWSQEEADTFFSPDARGGYGRY